MAYSIEGNSFSDYNMHVISCMGALDFPGRLGEADYDWNDDHGVEAYVLEDDLHWNGREITLLVWYNGSNFNYDMATFRSHYAGADRTLVTSYGTHTVTLQEIRLGQVYKSNQRVVLSITFWEPEVTVPEVPVAVGGSGITLGDYDFLQDFGLHAEKIEGMSNVNYRERELTYGVTPKLYCSSRINQRFSLILNGHYATLSALIDNINDLHAVLRSPGMKTLTYGGLTAPVYFADKATVTVVHNALVATVRMTLRDDEAVMDEGGMLIEFPGKDATIIFPGKDAEILFPE
jgi:hypothetical protein